MIHKIKTILASKKFYYFLIALFAIQAVYFSAVINYKVPSDEEYHFTLTQYYAQRPVTAGPIIADQSSAFNLGDIERIPSYLYHYTLSFYLRAVSTVTNNQDTQIFMLRLVNVALGVAALVMLAKIFKRINRSRLTINLTIAWLAMTGMFVWVFAGLSYDNLSILLFFAMLYVLIGMKDKLRLRQSLLAIVTALALLLTKETYVPIVLLSFLLLLGYRLKMSGMRKTIEQLRISIKQDWAHTAGRVVLLVLVALTIVFSGLFVERYVQNFVKYGKVTPTCDQVHTVDQCMQSSIYRRNTGQKAEFDAYKKANDPRLDNAAVFGVKWVGLIYERTYFYRGHQTITGNRSAEIVGAISASFILALLLYSLVRAKKISHISIALGILTIFYIATVFLYNLNTYYFYGYPFAIQGRYLLPVLPFVYMGVMTSLVDVYHQINIRLRNLLIATVLILILVNIAVHAPYIIYRNGHYILDAPVISKKYIKINVA